MSYVQPSSQSRQLEECMVCSVLPSPGSGCRGPSHSPSQCQWWWGGGDVEQLLLLMKNQARWRVLHAWPPIMYMCGWYYPYINEDKEAQGSLATCPRSHNWHVPKPGTEPSLCDSGEQPRTSWALLLPPGDQTQPEAPQAVFRLLYLPSRCLWASTAHAWISSSFHWS